MRRYAQMPARGFATYWIVNMTLTQLKNAYFLGTSSLKGEAAMGIHITNTSRSCSAELYAHLRMLQQKHKHKCELLLRKYICCTYQRNLRRPPSLGQRICNRFSSTTSADDWYGHQVLLVGDQTNVQSAT